MSRIGSRFLLIGTNDGKSTTFGDMWWLVAEGEIRLYVLLDDPIAKRAPLSPRSSLPPNSVTKQPETTQGQTSASPLSELRQRLGLPPAVVRPLVYDSSISDKDLLTLGRSLLISDGHTTSSKDPAKIVKAVREHWNQCDVQLIRLSELKTLLHDYQRLVAGLQRSGLLETSALHVENAPNLHVYHFYHLDGASQLRMDDIPSLLNEYKQLLHLHFKIEAVGTGDGG